MKEPSGNGPAEQARTACGEQRGEQLSGSVAQPVPGSDEKRPQM